MLATKLAIRHNPTLFPLIFTRRERPLWKARVARRGDDAVIEGYPRSANTFATYAFFESQGDGVKFGNHFHNPAQFFLAKRYGLPAMLCIRDPIDAGFSMIIFDSRVQPDEALHRYIAFHEPLLAIRDDFIVAPFDEITRDFGASIARMNAHFGSRFKSFDHDEAAAQRVHDRIDADRAMRAEHLGAVVLSPLTNSLPTAEKAAKRAELADSFARPALEPLKAKARRLFDVLTQDQSV